ncbi:ABC transporter thiamine pyrophosphate-binding lipoprotein p37/Cypl [Mycoplasma crocodyli]|uniref:Phosphate/phosphonate ABC transporter, solute-binding protein n=1 Tax=Mycoplasma crocodyli (strain ATCC 51981 / MP145) TaxID=512564 RepID=D5E5R8_MYCCM|nr:DNA repair protein HhH-GPD [Mycoplasma crocodyli]ADE19680.1 phosphate/phosphonate ABC transporter, solute-binding protein [Mycoplasma crocodyli MP145]
MKINMKKIGLFSASLALMSPVLLSVSCNNETNKKIDWDESISIVYNWENDSKWDKESFTNLLNQRFNELKNADPKLKDYKNVKFDLKVNESKNQMLQDLKSNKKDADVALISYSTFVNETIDDSFPHFVGTSGTLQFKWNDDTNPNYLDGSATDPLRKIANKENQLQFSAPFGEFKDWKDTKEIYGWDGSKYEAFYNLDKTTIFYHGSILISGTDQERAAIIKSWEDKNWAEFSKNGIVYKNKTSGGKFKYQISLIAKHFSNTFKNENEVVTWLDDPKNKEYVLSGKNASIIGQEQKDKRTFNIAFDDEGAFNWTPKAWGTSSYVPSKPNSFVRVLTVTNKAPYDAILGRVGLSKEQVDLISKVLNSLKINENTLGKYTGYNYFSSNKDYKLLELIDVQKNAEGIKK